jgi:hypothetical protein
MDDPLLDTVHVIKTDAEFLAIFPKGFDLLSGDRVVEGKISIYCRNRVIDRRECPFGTANGAARKAQSFKRLRRSYLVNELQIDVKKRGLTGFFINHMRIPDLVV